MPEWEFKGAHVALDCPEYTCELEEYRRGEDQMVFIHADIRKWKKEVLQRCKKEFELFREHVTCPLYACGQDDDAKWEAFVKLFGFQHLTDAVCTDGKRRRIFVNFKDVKNNAFKNNANVSVHDATVVGANPVSTTGVPRSA